MRIVVDGRVVGSNWWTTGDDVMYVGLDAEMGARQVFPDAQVERDDGAVEKLRGKAGSTLPCGHSDRAVCSAAGCDGRP